MCLMAGLGLPGLAQTQAGAELDLRAASHDEAQRLYAVEYARSEGVATSRLVRGGGATTVDMSWYFFVLVGRGHVTLIDVGTDAFSRRGQEALRERWSIAHATDVTRALARTGLSPADVTDIVLTHHHWDHVGALSLFGGATVHVHAGEWARVPARLRRPVQDAGRLATFEGRRAELWPGLVVREAGHHTAHQVMVEVGCGSRTWILASDAAYLRQNIEERKPVTVTVDRRANVADVAAAVQRVGAEQVIPGHDPALFTRHPSGVSGVAAICD